MIYSPFTGRYHCGKWVDFDLKISPVEGLLGEIDPDAGVRASFHFLYRRSSSRLDIGTYNLTGTYDAKTGFFHLKPKSWYGHPPAGFEMIGIEGTFDAVNYSVTAKMLSDKCDAVMLVPFGETLPPLPKPAVAGSASPGKAARPERREYPSNVTNYLDPAAYSPDFEYWETAWSDSPGTVHERSPIEESIENQQSDKFVCVGSQKVTWEASGIKGTAADRVGITERFIVECVGDCKGVFYRPYVGANVTHFGLSESLPTMQIKSVMFGGTTFRWNFSRTSNSKPPPEIYVHQWKPLTGFGPLDPGPAEIARRLASAPPCRAPRKATDRVAMPGGK